MGGLTLGRMTHHHSDGDARWVPCGTCWGQRRLWSPDADGALHAEACPTCLGLGERLLGGDQVPAPTP
ncbi:MAG TPA: hypothetical protein PKD59_09640 [Miltoncostaeaceae bacterium]|nr:hypothetical protein [Miltoncostaeaceae bacterium]